MPAINVRPVAEFLLISVAVIAGHLLPGLDNSLVEDGVRNGLHLLVFAAFATILFRYLASSGLAKAPRVFLTIFVVAIIGGLAELLQYLMGGLPDISDIGRDVAGATMALAVHLLWAWSGDPEQTGPMKFLARSASALVGFAVIAPLCFWLSIMGLGRMAAPVILDFDQWWIPYIYRPINAGTYVTEGPDRSVEILLQKRSLGGLVITPMISNWRRFETLKFNARMSKGSDTRVTVKINDSERRDSWSDRYIASIVVSPAATTIRIPLATMIHESGRRSIDLSDIQEIMIFARHPDADTVLSVDNIRIE